jgi:RHS repeat-associated protein
LLDFSGKPLNTFRQHRKATGGTVYAFTEAYAYTAQDRLQYQTHTIGTGTPQLMALNAYDNLGQLIGKKVGGTSTAGTGCFQNVDYSYNVRGWLTGINDIAALTKGSDPKDLFAFKINYNNPEGGVADALYNGNISETYWLTANDEIPRMYSYTYDGLNRLTDAVFQNAEENAVNNYFGERITGYDKNGNITGLERYGMNPLNNEPIQIDDMDYTYDLLNPNQLNAVDDDSDKSVGFKDVTNTVDYVYDANGNMVKDFNKGIGTSTSTADGIIYNHLNLPHKVTFANGDKIDYFYQADGVKIQKVVTQGTTVTTTDYIDGMQYTNNVLDFVPTAEGYVKNTVVNGTNTFSYVFNYTDHLGNVRLSYAKSPANVLTIMEEDNYYPFGMKHSGYNNNGYAFSSVSNALALVANGTQTYKYQYNGKEFQGELGLDWSDYGARNYDASIGRWMNIDPLAEKSRRWSPYNNTYNNPVYFIDPDGMEVINGETDLRKRLEKQHNEQQKNLDDKHGGDTHKSRKDFDTKEDYKAYKSSVKQYNMVSKALDQSIENEKNVQASINDFAESDPENFNKINNLTYTDSSGKTQDLDVTIKAGEASSYGGAVTRTSFFKNGDIESIKTTIDYDDVKPQSSTLAHEMGHAYNTAKNPMQAMKDMNTINCQDPANRNTFQSKTAVDWQQHYIIFKTINFLIHGYKF